MIHLYIFLNFYCKLYSLNFTTCGGPLGVKNDDKNTSLNTNISNTNDIELKADAKLNFGFSLPLS